MIPSITSKLVRPGIVFQKTVNVAPQLLYNAWTDAKQVAAWWGPHGFTNPVCIWDARANGNIYIEMTSADGMVFPMSGRFQEATPLETLTFTTSAFEGEDGEPQMVVLNKVTFTAGDRNAIYHLEMKLVKASPIVIELLAGMKQGWSQGLY
jgi:uncharacterized protein YndB with AHSA1/START domain